MTCKDCIHFKVCDEFGVFDEDVGENYEHKTCHDFLNKKQFNTSQFITEEELKLKKIKTIEDDIAFSFDKKVNEFLDNGYVLSNRYISNKGTFIAELELY